MIQWILIIPSILLLGLIVYFAVSPRSSRTLRIVAVIALILIGLSLGISLLFLLYEPGQEMKKALMPSLPSEPIPVKKTNLAAIITILVLLLLFLGLTIFLAVREERKRGRPAAKIDQ